DDEPPEVSRRPHVRRAFSARHAGAHAHDALWLTADRAGSSRLQLPSLSGGEIAVVGLCGVRVILLGTWAAPKTSGHTDRPPYSSERRAMLVGVRPSSQAPAMAAIGSPRMRTARSA